MLLHGLRESTQDIDMDVPEHFYREMLASDAPRKQLQDGNFAIAWNSKIDIHLGKKLSTEIVEGVGADSLEEVLQLKQRLNREKDQKDIVILKAYLGK